MLLVCLDCFTERRGEYDSPVCSACGSKDVIVLSSDPAELLLTTGRGRDTIPSPIYLYKDGKRWAKLSIQKAGKTGRSIR